MSLASATSSFLDDVALDVQTEDVVGISIGVVGGWLPYLTPPGLARGLPP